MENNLLIPKPYKIISVTPETSTEYTFRIETDMAPAFGQFVQVSIPRVGEAPISVSGFGSGWIDLTIRSVGVVTNGIFSLKAGDTLFLRGPYGKGFALDKYVCKHLVIAAGGTGVAPVRSLINHLYESGECSKIDLLFGFKNPSNVLFKSDIEKWRSKFPTILTVDEACGIWEGECTGLVTEYVKNIALSEYRMMEIIVVGPPMMMKFTVLEFIKMGVPKDKIWVSFERNMSCALGKCGHCKIDETYVCLEGPVFRYDRAEKLLD